MYGMWWIAIIFGVLTLIAVIGTIFIKLYFCLDMMEIVPEIIIIMLFGLFFILFMFLSIVNTKIADQEYKEFIATSEMIEQVYKEEQTLENAGLNQKVLEMNAWLTNARADKEVWGSWSIYCYLDLNEVKYISLKGGE